MDNLVTLRHSLSHLLALAIWQLYPQVKLGIGPAIDNGFYYDFDFDQKTTLKHDDLIKIQQQMLKLIEADLPFSQQAVTLAEAKKIFADQPYKLMLLDNITEPTVSIYRLGDLPDLCLGPHVNSTGELKTVAWRLARIAGAYWQGDEHQTMLTRIYGLAFATAQDLQAYDQQQLAAEQRDHRKIGKELDLFEFDEDVGAGLPLWLPAGAIIIEELEKLAKEVEFQADYQRVATPHIAKESMYLKSGHLPYYQDSMFPPMTYDGGKYYLKAMNCPHHHKIYASRPKTYKDLPVRLAEYGACYRHEKSGELFGLMRVRALRMNDAHIYCAPEQFTEEFLAVNKMYLQQFRTLGIDKYVMRLSTHSPDRLGKKYVNEPALWQQTEQLVREALQQLAIPFVEVADEAAFYGPKIDVQVWSAIGREFTLATNQVDFAMPKRFNLTYIDRDGQEKTPLCIHRAPLSTHERMVGFLIEHYAGNFPLWLSPCQVAILPAKDSHLMAAKELAQDLKTIFLRAKIFSGNDSLGKRLHQAKSQRPFYLLVIGDQEISHNQYLLEKRDGTKLAPLSKEQLLEQIRSAATSRQSDLT